MKKYNKPVYMSIGKVVDLTAGAASKGSETERACVNSNTYWANAIVGRA